VNRRQHASQHTQYPPNWLHGFRLLVSFSAQPFLQRVHIARKCRPL